MKYISVITRFLARISCVAYAEVTSYNKKNLEKELRNENQQRLFKPHTANCYVFSLVFALKWKEKYGENAHRPEESIYKRLQNYQRENLNRHMKRTIKN